MPARVRAILVTLVAGCTSFGSSAPGGTDAGGDAGGTDAGGDAGAPDAADGASAPPAVYDIPCWNDARCTGLQYCCDPNVTGMPTCMATCTGSGASFSCNDAEDCRARNVGGICCGYRESQNMVQTTCRASCQATEEHLCDPRAMPDECPPPTSCTRYTPDLNIGGFGRCM